MDQQGDVQGAEDEGNTPPEMEEEDLPNYFEVGDIALTEKMIEMIKNATLGDAHDNLDREYRHRLRNPPEEPLALEDPDLRLSVDVYLCTQNASQETYNAVRDSIRRRYPDNQMLSFDQVKRRMAELTGVVSIVHDMCINSCHAFVGPWAALEHCTLCGENRYDPTLSKGNKKVPRKQFHTLPIGPQLQALWKTPEGAHNMRYRERRTMELLAELEGNNGNIGVYDDIFCGSDYLDEVIEGQIQSGDVVLMLSIDGAQLYRKKLSDAWIYIWVILDLAPDLRYKKKHVLPGGVIPGPKPPKIPNSYLFVGLHHLSAIQNDGLKIWDAQTKTTFTSHPFFFLACADSVGLAPISGLVGHHGKKGCRIYCSLPGRHKRGKPHYYPVRLKPDEYTIAGCDHGDIPLSSLTSGSTQRYEENLRFLKNSPNTSQYQKRRKETGICKPTLFNGLPRGKRAPLLFSLDIMHHPALNIPELLLGLWRGTFECDKEDDKSSWDWAVLTGNTWKDHGEAVANATPYTPGSFDRPPRNPAEKLNSGYKAWEFLLYLYGLGPGLFYDVLPYKYWVHFCKLVYGVRLLYQKSITADQLRDAHKSLTEFSDEFETLYYQRKHSRMHFVRLCIHTLCHMSPEVTRVGPGICSSQWAVERTIGNLGEEIKQHSNPFANLAQRAIRRSQTNALKAMVPGLAPADNPLPHGALDLGHDYALLRAKDRVTRLVRSLEAAAINTYLRSKGIASMDNSQIYVTRWSRLRIPNGQIARSEWKESLKPLEKVRMARCVQVLSYNHSCSLY